MAPGTTPCLQEHSLQGDLCAGSPPRLSPVADASPGALWQCQQRRDPNASRPRLLPWGDGATLGALLHLSPAHSSTRELLLPAPGPRTGCHAHSVDKSPCQSRSLAARLHPSACGSRSSPLARCVAPSPAPAAGGAAPLPAPARATRGSSAAEPHVCGDEGTWERMEGQDRGGPVHRSLALLCLS